jgi:hypothetical protein
VSYPGKTAKNGVLYVSRLCAAIFASQSETEEDIKHLKICERTKPCLNERSSENCDYGTCVQGFFSYCMNIKKMSLCLTNYHAIKMYGGMVV